MTQHGLSTSGLSPLTQNLKMIDAMIRRCQLGLRPRREILMLIVNSGIHNPRMKIQDQVLQVCLRRNGDQGLEQRKTCQVWRVSQFQDWEGCEALLILTKKL